MPWRCGVRASVFDEAVDVMLSSVFTGWYFEYVGYTQQCLLGVTICHHLQQTNSGITWSHCPWEILVKFLKSNLQAKFSIIF